LGKFTGTGIGRRALKKKISFFVRLLAIVDSFASLHRSTRSNVIHEMAKNWLLLKQEPLPKLTAYELGKYKLQSHRIRSSIKQKSLKFIASLQKSHFPSSLASRHFVPVAPIASRLRSFANAHLLHPACSFASFHFISTSAAVVQENRFSKKQFSKKSTHTANAGAIFFVVIFCFAPASAVISCASKTACHCEFIAGK
jgi:hypothetical protein